MTFLDSQAVFLWKFAHGGRAQAEEKGIKLTNQHEIHKTKQRNNIKSQKKANNNNNIQIRSYFNKNDVFNW